MTSDLRGLEAKRGGANVGSAALHQVESAFLRQPQIRAGDQVAQAEGLAPAGVAPAPPDPEQPRTNRTTTMVMWCCVTVLL